jgi:2-keto-4-pentenoate hydratase/2-oxohepta-3-ene-1,7-dioic acid hydratase in catechol pathway
MKLLRVGDAGREIPAALDATGRLRDLSRSVRDIDPGILGEDVLDRLRGLDLTALPEIAGSLRNGPCVAGIRKIVCVGLNYRDHALEAALPIPAEPVLFLKATSAIVGPDDEVEIPRGAEKVDWEVELGVIIGTTCKYCPVARALEHVAGYCIVNDLSERAYQLERGGQWDKGKSCDTFAPIGPWLVTRDEIGDPQNLDIWLEVDGRRVQHSNTRAMIFPVAELVSYISRFMTLQPGDVISTGTPAGVGLGHKPPVYLQPGQVMRLGIAGLGTQQQRAVAAPEP